MKRIQLEDLASMLNKGEIIAAEYCFCCNKIRYPSRKEAAAAGAEIATGQTISQQFAEAPFGVLLTFSMIIAGSLFSYTANMEAPAAGPFTKEKELLNGRAAMVGMGIMLAYETVKGSALL